MQREPADRQKQRKIGWAPFTNLKTLSTSFRLIWMLTSSSTNRPALWKTLTKSLISWKCSISNRSRTWHAAASKLLLDMRTPKERLPLACLSLSAIGKDMRNLITAGGSCLRSVWDWQKEDTAAERFKSKITNLFYGLANGRLDHAKTNKRLSLTACFR